MKSHTTYQIEDWGWLAELDGWEGYEFWSAQIEAEAETRGDLESDFSYKTISPKEGGDHVFPF